MRREPQKKKFQSSDNDQSQIIKLLNDLVATIDQQHRIGKENFQKIGQMLQYLKAHEDELSLRLSHQSMSKKEYVLTKFFD
jgi:hypothetical protein